MRITCCRGLPKAERELLDIAIVTAADAVELLLADGPEAAMTKFNGLTPDARYILAVWRPGCVRRRRPAHVSDDARATDRRVVQPLPSISR